MRPRLARKAVGSAVAALIAATALVALAPASDALTATVPITCDVPGTSGVHLSAVATVNGPFAVLTGHTYNVTFKTEIPGLSPTPIGVYGFTMTSNYDVVGAAAPSGPISFTQGPTDYPSPGSTVAFSTFTQTFTATGPAGGVAHFDLTSIDYVFSLSAGGSPVSVHCTLDGGPYSVTKNQVRSAAARFLKPSVTLRAARLTVPYVHRFKAAGGPIPEYSLSGGTLPPGLDLAKDGTLSGTPTKLGTYVFSVTATNGIGQGSTQVVTLPVIKAPKPR
jgi:hypothetical protein